jgi:hypothetical protein
MASPPPRKESKMHGLLKVPRRVFNRARDAISRPHSPGTSTVNINIPNDDPGVVRDHAILSTPHSSSQRSSALLGTDSADRAGETPGVEGNQDTIFTISHASSQQSSPHPSHPESNISEKINKAWSVTQSGLLTALRLLEKSAGAFPPLKSAVGGLVACLDLAQVSYGCGSNTVYHV